METATTHEHLSYQVVTPAPLQYIVMTALFISIDGVDGCGKSTQIELLTDWLKRLGHSVVAVRDPGGTRLGESLREILLQRVDIPLSMTAEMLMYMASRSQLVEEIVSPALRAGQHVVSDRYLLANVVYQGSAGGLEPEEIWRVGVIATRTVTPDLTVVLDIDPEIAYQRMKGGLDRMEQRGVDYMRKVREGFLAQGKRLGDKLIVLDASLPIHELHQRIVVEVTRRLAQHQIQAE